MGGELKLTGEALERERLRELTQQMRKRAAPIGPLHSFWDIIFDNEAFLTGGATLISLPIEDRIAEAEQYLSE